ncbi:hypothetical protein NIES4074_08530 [Cylindrospermum sp. NIES-4074]|nr:hypothetical protein NIES4074_08530 [Cylindrospermum sp. NIES-4074]
MEKISLKSMSGRQLDELASKIKRNNEIYTSPFEDIGKLVAKELIGDDIFSELSVEDIRNQFIIDNEESIPKQEQDFFIYICKTYLLLETEPRFHLLELYQNASDDLKKVEENINKCHKYIKEQRQKRDNIEDEDAYRIPMFEYFIEINQNAKAEIINFITSNKIKNLAFRKSSKFGYLYFLEILNYTYSFRQHNTIYDRYDVDKFSEFKHKFNLSPVELDELEQLYINDRTVFWRRTQEYITTHKIPEVIREWIKSHHRLNARRDVLAPALDLYEKDKVLFLNLIPLQIEGIFYDYCLDIGISEKNLRSASIGEKLDKIAASNKILYNFEYFKFKFPLIRNKVAHGKLISAEESINLSSLMILDLYYVCDHIVSEQDTPVNKIVKLIQKNCNKSNYIINNDIIKIIYAILKDIKIPDFYNLQTTINTVEIICL